MPSTPGTTGRRQRADSSMASTRKVERERKSTQLLLLTRAFDVLDRMKARDVDRDDLVYRALIDAACRIGSTYYAMTVLKEMRHDRIRPSALFFSCLLSAFAMDGTLKSGGKGGGTSELPMGELTAWMSESADTAPSVDSRSEQSRKSKRGHEKRESTMQQVAAAMTNSPISLDRAVALYAGERGRLPTSDIAVNEVSMVSSSSSSSSSSSTSNTFAVGGSSNIAMTNVVANDNVASEATSALSLQHKTGNLSRHGYALLQTLFPSLHIETDMETCPKCHVSLNRSQILDGFADDPNNYKTQCAKCEHWFVAYFSVLCNSPDWVGTQGPKSPLYFTALSPWVLKKEMLTMLIQSRSGGEHSKDGGNNEHVGAQHLRHGSSTIFWNLVLYFHLFGLPCEFLVDQEEIDEVTAAAAVAAAAAADAEHSASDELPPLPERPSPLDI